MLYLGFQDMYPSKRELKRKNTNQHSVHLSQKTITKSPENIKEKNPPEVYY